MKKKNHRLSTTTRDDLITHFVDMMRCDNATIFAGAGLSLDSGMPTWGNLMELPIQALGFDTNDPGILDYYDVAEKYVQYHASRTALSNLLVRKISAHDNPGDTHGIITRLPLSRIWTSNFDLLLEEAYKKSGKKYTAIRRDLDFTISYAEDVKIYKMHGCITLPESMVITKTDVQTYERNFEIMSKAFHTALAEDTFLFVGFSFKDPHFETVLGSLRGRYADNLKQHFAVMKKPEKESEYQSYSLMINNLARYGILTLVVEDYSEVALLLKDIEKAYIRSSMFLSGSFDKNFHKKYVQEPVTYTYEGVDIEVPYPRNPRLVDEKGKKVTYFYLDKVKDGIKKELDERPGYQNMQKELEQVLEALGRRLYESGMNIYTGYGMGVCDTIVEGFSKMFKDFRDYHSSMGRLNIFPLPLRRRVNAFHDNFYREKLIGACGMLLLIRGGTYNSDYTSGTFEEYYIAKGLSDLLLGRQKQVQQLFIKCMEEVADGQFFHERKFKKKIARGLHTQKKLIGYQYQEITEMFYRTLYEQWKLVIRLMDGYQRRGIIIFEKKLLFVINGNDPKKEEKEKLKKEIDEKWKAVRSLINNCVLARTLRFYNQFETEPMEDAKNSFGKDELNYLLDAALDLDEVVGESGKHLVADDAETVQKAKAICYAIIRLVQGDYKYLTITEILEIYRNREISLLRKATSIKKNISGSDKRKEGLSELKKEHFQNFTELWKSLVLKYKNCVDVYLGSAESGYTNQEMAGKDSYKESSAAYKKTLFRFKKEYILKEQFDYLFEEDAANAWENLFKKDANGYIASLDEEKFTHFTHKAYRRYHELKLKEIKEIEIKDEEVNESTIADKGWPVLIENKTAIMENIPRSAFYKIQTYKLLLVLTDVIGGLQRVIADFETINVSLKKNQNKQLRQKLFTGKGDSDEPVIQGERKMDPFFYDPNKFHEVLELHKDYIKYYWNHVDFLQNMMAVNRYMKQMSLEYKNRRIKKYRSKKTGEEKDVPTDQYALDSGYVAWVKSLVDRTMNTVYEHKKEWEEKKEKYTSIPLRPATVIIPLACYGGMARKIWYEERIRFDYLCSFKHNFTRKKRNELMYHYDRLYYLAEHGRDEISNNGNSNADKSLDTEGILNKAYDNSGTAEQSPVNQETGNALSLSDNKTNNVSGNEESDNVHKNAEQDVGEETLLSGIATTSDSGNTSTGTMNEKQGADSQKLEKMQQKMNEILDSVFCIIDAFRQSTKVGATKPL